MYQEYKVNEIIKINEMFSLFTHFYGKDYVFSGEKHNFWECVAVLDGSICVSADERVYKLKRNEIIFHKPLELHKFHIDDPSGATLLIFSFSLSGSYANFFADKVFSLKLHQGRYLNEFTEFLEKDGEKADNIKYFNKSETYSQMAASYIYRLFLSLIEENHITSAPLIQSGDARIFSSAVSYMTQNIAESTGVSDIAKKQNISETGLKQIFKKYAGMGVHQYYISLKINAAIQMLMQGMPVCDIADRLGFSSQGYFSYVFKRETGYSPGEYRKKL